MANSLIQYAYVSGEVSPKLYGRSDLEKYDLGLSEARNWLIDYRGGMSTRPGTEFREWLQHPGANIKWFPFEFSPNVANTNIVVFGFGYIRFLQEGLYVLEAAKTVSGITVATTAIVTSVAHGFTTGDLVKLTNVVGPATLANRTFEIVVLSSDTFSLKDQFGLAVPSTVAFLSGQVARVYTIVSPYTHTELPNLQAEQSRDLLRLTHFNYTPFDLRRTGSASWVLSQTEFNAQVPAPAGLSGTGSGAGTAGAAFAVTAVDYNGNESLPSEVLLLGGIVNYTVTAGSAIITWAAVPNTAYYNVYRSTVYDDSTRLSRSAQLGILGRAKGPYFVDTNIIPNFTISPPEYNNPFAAASIQWVNVTATGAGYDQSSGVSIVDGAGTGASAYPVVNPSGALIAVVVKNGGQGYTGPTIVTSGPGSGATFTVQVSSASGNNPSIGTVFQQRQIYAGSTNSPLSIWGSRPRRFNNFDNSAIIVDNDSYSFEVDARQVSTITHLRAMRGGLLVMNEVGIWQLTGGSQVAVTPTNALAEPQSYTGVSSLPPIQIETDLLYCEAKGFTARLLSYNDLAKLYAGTDISILSAHLFGKGKELKSWSFAQDPFKIVHAIREDGVRLLGTIVKDQNVFSWTPSYTKGYYRQVLVIREDKRDRVYFDVERRIRGVNVRYIELEADREFQKIEDAWSLDSALSLTPTFPAASVQAAATSGAGVAFTASAAVFSSGDVGKIIFGGGAKAVVTFYVSTTQVLCTFLRPQTALYPETETPQVLSEGEWTLDAPISTVSGLWHLEGQEVSILADGNVMPPRTVVNGAVTLDAPVSRAIVGLSYKCVARTLPLTVSGAVVEDKRKRIVGIATRVLESRGLFTGPRLDSLYESKDRTTEMYGQPILPRTDMRYNAVATEWDEDGRFYLVVEDPLPVTVLGHVLSVEVGDDEG